jgi:hypothetical protein
VTNSVSDLVLVLVVVLLLGVVMRWVFRPSRRYRGAPMTPVDAAAAGQLGLLVVLGPGLARAKALGMRADLGRAGIRSSMSQLRDGRLDVLVFATDLDRARAVIGSQ